VLSERYRLWRKREYGTDFIVCAMFTPDYRHFAERLVASLNRFSIAHALYEVPQIYHSISPKGGTDPEFSKPHFIRNLLKQFGRPVLYSDADLIFRKPPDLLSALCAQDCDFVTYNWLADPMNDAWRPEPGWRLWKFYFRVDLASDTQLMASGGVQMWRGTAAAFTLLDGWEQSLRDHPRSEDDHCLDFAYNLADHTGLKSAWLTKEYVRLPFWIYADPVIDHPEFPTPITGYFRPLGSRRFVHAELIRRQKTQPFPRDATLDVEAGQLLMPGDDGGYFPAGPLPLPVFLPRT
jgi:hypothetical protein